MDIKFFNDVKIKKNSRHPGKIIRMKKILFNQQEFLILHSRSCIG